MIDAGGSSGSKQLSSGPKTRVCYICGRQYGLSSFNIHVKQCEELWIAREEKKDPKERKPVPVDPTIAMLANKSNVEVSNKPESSSKQNNGMDLDEINRLASEAFNTSALDTCKYCNRTFLPEKLVIHNKSCTADNPARKVTDSVNRAPSTKEVSRPTLSKYIDKSQSSGNVKSANNSSNPDDSLSSNGKILAGSIGGSAGREIRSSKIQINSINMNEDILPQLYSRLEQLESITQTLAESITETKAIINKVISKNNY